MLQDPDVTDLLHAWSRGEHTALDRLIPMVFDELHRMASFYLQREARGHTLQPTALINEVYLRMFGEKTQGWENRKQFFGFSAKLMRHVLVDHARARRATKRGGEAVSVPFEEAMGIGLATNVDVIALDLALQRLAEIAPRQVEVVQLRYFVGLTVPEVADVLELSPATVKREWQAAKFWLHRALHPAPKAALASS